MPPIDTGTPLKMKEGGLVLLQLLSQLLSGVISFLQLFAKLSVLVL